MILFLDDCKYRTKKLKQNIPSALCFHNAQDIIKAIAKNSDPIEILFLDHDLEGQIYCDSDGFNTGMEVIRWIEKNKPKIDKVIVHSLNKNAATVMTERLMEAGYNVKQIPFVLINWNELGL